MNEDMLKVLGKYAMYLSSAEDKLTELQQQLKTLQDMLQKQGDDNAGISPSNEKDSLS